MSKLASLAVSLAACASTAPARPAAVPAAPAAASAAPATSPTREPRAGYDVYRGCPTATAVVRATGSRPADTHGAMLAVLRADLPATPGGGHPCVRDRTETGFIEIHRPDELEPVLAAIGAWMVRDDVRGEVDVVYEGRVEVH